MTQLPGTTSPAAMLAELADACSQPGAVTFAAVVMRCGDGSTEVRTAGVSSMESMAVAGAILLRRASDCIEGDG